ncbi:nucleotide exchange factor GrpE [Candidatus Gottesmanbacteria bacterium RIFCSPHIGHO2_01_FULL_42_12]|uniref:Protein GrpE n=1 Tax=Candidatus Gottesmanbacteria bacterium RIFCSPHIGHO2_01_FULL_42_12 TaxID=1798377 RepID=A0A1F5Z4H0_9BACT|nr:MAG: nucleotide exchange factor GrpE [Candidatus Gottesmanbacteria bacterium RIFCSPHIGHO2_01_FULL_42_12]
MKNNHDEEENNETQEFRNKYLRALADYQNLEKQTQNWREEFVKFANQGLISQLLEVLDDLEKAQDHLKDEGLQIVLDKLIKILKNNGIEELEVLGQEYNPEFAEVIGMEPGGNDNIIVKVLQKGYKLNSNVLRVAKVIVSKKE